MHPTRRRLDADHRRAAILASARERYAAALFPEVSVADVAARAGASPALVHHYFGDKRALFLAASREELEAVRTKGLTDEESLKILTAVCRTRAKGRTIVAGCGRESAYKTVEFIKQTADCGMDMAFVLPPSYFKDKMTDEALKAYFIAVADRSPVPVVVYNAPKFASGLLVSVPLYVLRHRAPLLIGLHLAGVHVVTARHLAGVARAHLDPTARHGRRHPGRHAPDDDGDPGHHEGPEPSTFHAGQGSSPWRNRLRWLGWQA